MRQVQYQALWQSEKEYVLHRLFFHSALVLHRYIHIFNGLVTIHQMPKNTVNFNSTNKGSNWLIETENCEGTSRSSSQAASHFIRK